MNTEEIAEAIGTLTARADAQETMLTTLMQFLPLHMTENLLAPLHQLREVLGGQAVPEAGLVAIDSLMNRLKANHNFVDRKSLQAEKPAD